MKTKIQCLLIALTFFAGLPRAAAQSIDDANTMTYQGKLSTPTGLGAGGSYDLTFALFNTSSGGSPGAGPITNTATAVNSNGLFTTTLNFGAGPFTGTTTNWLQIAVRTNGNGAFTTLTPRQLLTSVPQSIYALSAGTAGVADAVAATTVIQGQSLDVGLGNTLNGAYPTIAGGSSNTVSSDYGTISGGFGNTVSSNLDTVAGGSNNTANGPNATVGGGAGNTAIGANATVAGGSFNSAIGTNATVAGGDHNTALDYDFVGGGQSNTITAGYAQIVGGLGNTAAEPFGVVNGGLFNHTSAFADAIGGGGYNMILANAAYSTIGGGESNKIQTFATESTISGGTGNTIQAKASDATISGGSANIIATNFATIPGGQQALATNYAQLAYSSGMFANPGDSQYSLYVLRGTTPAGSNIVANLFLDGVIQEIALPATRSCTFTVRIVGRSAGVAGLSCAFVIEGGANGASGGASFQNTTLPLWNPLAVGPATISVGGGFLHVQVTSTPSAIVRWTATVETAEVSF